MADGFEQKRQRRQIQMLPSNARELGWEFSVLTHQGDILVIISWKVEQLSSINLRGCSTRPSADVVCTSITVDTS